MLYIVDKSVNVAARLPKNVTKMKKGPFGHESAIDFDTPSGTNARFPSQGKVNIKNDIYVYICIYIYTNIYIYIYIYIYIFSYYLVQLSRSWE